MTDYDTSGETFLDIDTSDAMEPTVAAPDTEHLIRIIGYKKDEDGKIVRTSDSGWKYFLVLFEFPNDISAKTFSQIYSVPNDQMDAKQVNSAKWDIECLKRCFGVTELNFNDMIGKEGYAIIGVKEDSYGEQNYIKKLITGA